MKRAAVTPSEIGLRVGLSSQTIRLDIHAGELEAYRSPGGHFRVLREVADQYVRRMTHGDAFAATQARAERDRESRLARLGGEPPKPQDTP